MIVTLTETAIKKAIKDAPVGGRVEWRDKETEGLRVRITRAGAVWSLACRDRAGRMRRFPIGPFSAIGISDARKKAKALHVDVTKEGAVDPVAARRDERASAKDAAAGIGTLRALLDHYETMRGKQLRSWPDCRRQIANVFGKHLDRPLRSLKAGDLQATADLHRSQQAAAAAVRYIRPVIGWAAKRGMVDAALGSLDQPAKVQQRERVLTDAELTAIWHGVEAKGIPPTFAKLVRLLILTGQRREEVAAMAWGELSADKGKWTIPSARAKNKTAHAVPLCEAVRTVLPEIAGHGPVFPGQRGTPFAGWGHAKAALDQAAGVTAWRIHDIRRTVATGLQRLGVRLEVTEAVLGHVSGSRAGIVGVYQRHTWDVEKRVALSAWADHVASLVAGQAAPSNVVTLPARSAA